MIRWQLLHHAERPIFVNVLPWRSTAAVQHIQMNMRTVLSRPSWAHVERDTVTDLLKTPAVKCRNDASSEKKDVHRVSATILTRRGSWHNRYVCLPGNALVLTGLATFRFVGKPEVILAPAVRIARIGPEKSRFRK